MNERERVLAIKGGDHQAFIDLYNEYWSQVYDFSRLYIATIADAEEIVQDVFVKLWESRHLLKEDENIKALFDGVELTLKELLSTVSRFGVEPVGAVGDTFNPDLHQAISMQPAEGFTTNQITTVLQKGYTLNGRVIRPAMVMVAA